MYETQVAKNRRRKKQNKTNNFKYICSEVITNIRFKYTMILVNISRFSSNPYNFLFGFAIYKYFYFPFDFVFVYYFAPCKIF